MLTSRSSGKLVFFLRQVSSRMVPFHAFFRWNCACFREFSFVDISESKYSVFVNLFTVVLVKIKKIDEKWSLKFYGFLHQRYRCRIGQTTFPIFQFKSPTALHCMALYLKDNEFIPSSREKAGVGVSNLLSKQFPSRFTNTAYGISLHKNFESRAEKNK